MGGKFRGGDRNGTTIPLNDDQNTLAHDLCSKLAKLCVLILQMCLDLIYSNRAVTYPNITVRF